MSINTRLQRLEQLRDFVVSVEADATKPVVLRTQARGILKTLDDPTANLVTNLVQTVNDDGAVIDERRIALDVIGDILKRFSS